MEVIGPPASSFQLHPAKEQQLSQDAQHQEIPHGTAAFEGKRDPLIDSPKSDQT